jgi:TPR repeat protein
MPEVVVQFWVITGLALQSAFAPVVAPSPILTDHAAARTHYELIRTALIEPQDSTDALRRDAERGDAQAQYKLALAYDVGVGAPQDLGQAAAWYERAAEQGHPGAQFSLGLMYGNGRGVPQGLVRAHMWLNLAAAASQPGARGERDLIAKKMTRAQIAEAVRQARAWEPKTSASGASQVPPGPPDEHNGPH